MLAVIFAACSGGGAAGGVESELEKLKSSGPSEASLAAVKEDLPEEAGDDFEAFLAKVRDFDYKVLGSEVKNDGDGKYTLVTVKITSYDFGREYLATWKDYLKTHENASAEDAEGAEFYTELFSRLAGLKKKQHVSYVDVKATEAGDGSWTTDIQTSEELQDALFGGMIGEMKDLADE
jgi:hypothetical protein